MKLEPFLTSFGLTSSEQEVFILLSKSDWKTVLSLAQVTSIKRTTLYRVLDSLKKKVLIEERLDDKTTYYRISGVENFETIVREQENHVRSLRDQLKQFSNQLQITTPTPPAETQVTIHRGKRGLQALEWKIVKQQQGEVLVLGGDKWWEVVSQDFAEKKRAEYVSNGVKIRELLNNPELIPDNLKVSWTKNAAYLKDHYRHRQIDKKVLHIENETYILPNSVIIFSIMDNEVVGIEICNAANAQLMRQFFEMAWQQAKVVDQFGSF